jgi:hypothetical protein
LARYNNSLRNLPARKADLTIETPVKDRGTGLIALNNEDPQN